MGRERADHQARPARAPARWPVPVPSAAAVLRTAVHRVLRAVRATAAAATARDAEGRLRRAAARRAAHRPSERAAAGCCRGRGGRRCRRRRTGRGAGLLRAGHRGHEPGRPSAVRPAAAAAAGGQVRARVGTGAAVGGGAALLGAHVRAAPGRERASERASEAGGTQLAAGAQVAVWTRSLPGRRDGPLPLAAALRGLRTASSRAAAATAAILWLPGGSESGRRPAGLGAASLRASRSQRERRTGGARPSNRRRAARTGGAAAQRKRSAEIGSRWPDSAPQPSSPALAPPSMW